MMVISFAGSPSRKMVSPGSAKRSVPCVASHSYSNSSMPCRGGTRLRAAMISPMGVGFLGARLSGTVAMLAVFIDPYLYRWYILARDALNRRQETVESH